MKNSYSNFLKNIFLLIPVLIISCGSPNNQTKENKKTYEDEIQGFWERKGTIQFINEIPVDTLFYADGDINEAENFRNIKAFSNNNIMWINNAPDNQNPWKGGAGGYGKYKIYSYDSLTEYMSHGTGFMGAIMKYRKDSLNIDNVAFPFSVKLNGEYYYQKGGRLPDNDNAGFESQSFAEYYEKMPKTSGKTKLDGVWRRAYEISYVNGVAVDTTSVPSDVVLDVKIMRDGYFMYQVDQTGLYDQSKAEYGGFGGFGQFEYDGKNTFIEYDEFGSGNWLFNSAPKTRAHYANISFYNDDAFIQITKDTLDQMNKGRGVVYKRVK